ncbi:MAG: hypothetical protein V4750_07750 [Pseudomonadota bacterium]
MNRPARTRQRARILLLLAAALVFVQLLGMMHAVLHDHARTGAAAQATRALVVQAGDESFIGALFSGHDSQADCDEFDHITHTDHVGFDTPAFAVQRADRIEVATHAGWHIARQASGFLARGPPSQV